MAKQSEPKQAIAKINGHSLPDLDRLSPEDRDAFMKVFMAGVGAAAAIQAQEAIDAGDINIPEFYGKSPTDLRREYSKLPRPAQGGDGGRYQQRRANGGS
jgi:hypothetical protein